MSHRARFVALLAPHRHLATSIAACLLLILFPTGRAGSPLCPLIHGDPISLRVHALLSLLVRYMYSPEKHGKILNKELNKSL
jgi:hypothetical protein